MANNKMVQYKEIASAMVVNKEMTAMEVVHRLFEVHGVAATENTIRTRLSNACDKYGICKKTKSSGRLYFVLTPELKEKMIAHGESMAYKTGSSLSRESRLQALNKNCHRWNVGGIKGKPGDTVVMIGF